MPVEAWSLVGPAGAFAMEPMKYTAASAMLTLGVAALLVACSVGLLMILSRCGIARSGAFPTPDTVSAPPDDDPYKKPRNDAGSNV